MQEEKYIDEYINMLMEVDKTSGSILKRLRSIEKDTPLYDAIREVNMKDEHTLILNYYITSQLTLDDVEELTNREAELEAITYDVPFKIEVNVYEPDPRPAIILRSGE